MAGHLKCLKKRIAGMYLRSWVEQLWILSFLHVRKNNGAMMQPNGTNPNRCCLEQVFIPCGSRYWIVCP